MIERLFRGFKAGLKGELILWTILLGLSGIIFLITSLI
jgi:hypothetical protein